MMLESPVAGPSASPSGAPRPDPASYRFGSVLELLEAHRALKRSMPANARELGSARRRRPEVSAFIRRAVATGTILETGEERYSAQGAINYWRSLTEDDDCEEKTDCTYTTRDADLLDDYEPDTLDAAIELAEQFSATLSPDRQTLARKMGLRLVRLRPDSDVFDPVPATRASLMELGPDADVKAILVAWRKAGVIRSTPGETEALEEFTLKSPLLIRKWPSLLAWQEVRLDRRRQAAKWQKRYEAPGVMETPQRRMLKAIDAVIRMSDRLRIRLVRHLPNFLTQRGAVEVLFNGDILEEARAYHDRTAIERSFHNEAVSHSRLVSSRNRLVTIGACLVALALIPTLFLTMIQLAVALSERERANAEARVEKIQRFNAERDTARADEKKQESLARVSLSSLRILVRAQADVMAARSVGERTIKRSALNKIFEYLPSADDDSANDYDFR